MRSDAIARLLDPGYLDGLRELPLDEIRDRRAECQELESALSYVRRLAQGRLDLVLEERRHRADGDASDVGGLVDQLKRGEIIGDRVRAPGLGRLPEGLEPPDEADELCRELDHLAGGALLSRLTELPDDDVERLATDLEEYEREVSGHRRSLHERIDALQAEIVRRYAEGEASVDTLLT